MKKFVSAVGGIAVAASAIVVLSQGGADAHHPEVALSCISGPATIRITATAWDAPTADERVNNRVQVTFDGVPIGVGAFNAANNYTFTLDVLSPVDTGTHVVRATSLVAWGAAQDDQAAIGVGEYREASITLPCGGVPSATTTTTAPATSTTAPGTGTTPTTTVATQVQGVTQTRPPAVAAVPVAVSPRFAG